VFFCPPGCRQVLTLYGVKRLLLASATETRLSNDVRRRRGPILLLDRVDFLLAGPVRQREFTLMPYLVVKVLMMVP